MAYAYAGFCERYPAFLDSALAIMRRPAGELNAIVSEVIWLRLGRAMLDCIDHVARILRAGNESGVFDVKDPDFTANMLWTQMLGAMHLARIRVGMKRSESRPARALPGRVRAGRPGMRRERTGYRPARG